MFWLHGVLGLAVPAAAVVVLGVVSARVLRRSPRARRAGYGLLVEVANAQEPAQADQVRDRLARAGVRGTFAPSGRVRVSSRGDLAPPGISVLVFPEDFAAARTALARPDRHPDGPDGPDGPEI